jgi:hypothetical protein
MSGRRALLAITVIVVAVAVVVGVLVWPWVRIYTNAAPPDQFSAPLSPPALSGRSVLAVAHNAGNNAATTAAALRYGAEVIEIDVVRVRAGLLQVARMVGGGWPSECSAARHLPVLGTMRQRRRSSSWICSRMIAGCSMR